MPARAISTRCSPRNEHDNAVVLDFVRTLGNASIRTIGPELVFGRLFDEIGFGEIPEKLFRDIVITRLVYPTSKLKTVDYLHRQQGKTISAESCCGWTMNNGKFMNCCADWESRFGSQEIKGDSSGATAA